MIFFKSNENRTLESLVQDKYEQGYADGWNARLKKEKERKSMTEIGYEAFMNALDHGFYDVYYAAPITTSNTERFVLGELALITSEIGECVHEIQQGALEHVASESLEREVADVIIRTLNLAFFLGMNVDEAVKSKMEYNSTREYMHGKKC